MPLFFAKTGCKTVDELLDGGFPSGMLSLVFGDREIGKTWMCIQTAFHVAGVQKKRVLYVDTEVQLTDYTMPRYFSYFQKRWCIPDDTLSRIDVVFTEDIFDLCRLSGFILQIEKKQAKTVPRIKFPSKWGDKRSDRPDLKESLQTSDWVYNSYLYKMIEEKKYSLVIIDSWTSPVKQVIESEEQNYSGRRSLESPLFTSWSTIARRLNTSFVVTGHGVSFRDRIVPDPWGGNEVKGNFKIQLAIVRLRADEKKKLQNQLIGVDITELRHVLLKRHPYKKDIMPRLVRLKWNTGFVDVEREKSVKL